MHKKVYLQTFGCKVNQYNSQLLRDGLKVAGMEFCPDYKEADFVLANSCTVTAEADRQCRQLIRKVLRENNRAWVVVTGCYPVRTHDEN